MKISELRKGDIFILDGTEYRVVRLNRQLDYATIQQTGWIEYQHEGHHFRTVHPTRDISPSTEVEFVR